MTITNKKKDAKPVAEVPAGKFKKVKQEGRFILLSFECDDNHATWFELVAA